MTPTPLPTTELIDGWLHLWNGDLDRAEGLIGPGFRLHAALMGGADDRAVDSASAVAGWIAQLHGLISDLTFGIEVGPLVDGDHVALRWVARGTYAGGLPGAHAPIGTAVSFTGTDLLRVHGGRLVEYWLNSDTLDLVTQLQAVPA